MVLLPIAFSWHICTVVSVITDMIHRKKQVIYFLLARLNPELSRAICCTSIWHTCRPLSPSLSLSCKVNTSNATPAKLLVNINCPAVLTKGFAINGNTDEGALIASSKYSSSRFCQDHPSWFPNSSLLTSAFYWVAQCRSLRDTPRSSVFRQLASSFVVSRAIHQGRAVFIDAFLSRGSHVTCFPMAWCCIESHSLRKSISHVCPLVEPLFAFAFWGLKSSFAPGFVEASISHSTLANILGAELLL